MMETGHLYISNLDGAFKKLKTEGDSGGGMSVHNPSHNPSSSCPTPARRRHRTTFTQVWTNFQWDRFSVVIVT